MHHLERRSDAGVVALKHRCQRAIGGRACGEVAAQPPQVSRERVADRAERVGEDKRMPVAVVGDDESSGPPRVQVSKTHPPQCGREPQLDRVLAVRRANWPPVLRELAPERHSGLGDPDLKRRGADAEPGGAISGSTNATWVMSAKLSW